MSARAALLVALCVCLAGCGAAGPLPGDDSADADGPTDDATTTGTDAEAAAASPWAGETVVVGVDGDVNDSREWAPLVASATAYWTGDGAAYLDYPVSFDVRPDAANPDVIVRFVERVADCPETDDPVGCAPYVTDQAVDRPVRISVEAGLSDASTELVLEHEFGHVLGLDHDDPPQAVMGHSTPITTLPQANATERRLPWNDSTLSVYVDDDAVDDPEATREQVRAALAYYERGANGTVPDNVTFETVADPERADVVVRFADERPCGAGDGSCGERGGVDPDGDGAPERYDRLTITVAGVPTEAVGWHVAYWLGYGFGFTDGDWPAPLSAADDPEDRRGEWWRH